MNTLVDSSSTEQRTEAERSLKLARRQTDDLFSVIRPEFLYERPIEQRHRIVFYIGHVDAFDFIQICRNGLGLKSRQPGLDRLFEAGIDPDAGHLPSDQPENWPDLKSIYQYVAECRRNVDEALGRAPADTVAMAIEHRLMHLETLAYMWHNLPYEMKQGPQEGAPLTDQEPRNEWCEVSTGLAVLGKPVDSEFGWDNEYLEHTVSVPAFEIQRFKVTNRDYGRFIDETGAALPRFWVKREEQLFYRGMFEEIPLPPAWPVYVTQREAEFYAAWAGGRLPTEAEFHRAAYGSHTNCARQYPWGNSKPNPELGNFDFRRWDPEPVTATPGNESAFGLRQLVGNGWEWTSTLFRPFEGFVPSPNYPGYSANFFDEDHFVLKGGSPRTAARLLRPSFRNWFRADYPYVYATFRCVKK
jgi:formylglycine-generating enzyme required for sulfatase activity